MPRGGARKGAGRPRSLEKKDQRVYVEQSKLPFIKELVKKPVEFLKRILIENK